MIAVDLFAGGGGAALGLARAGIEHAACVDFDEDAVVVARRLGLPAVCARVEEWTPPSGSVDLVWASCPCQDWSTAGKRRGAQGQRNGYPALFAALDRMAEAGCSPRWLLGEQVPGILAHKSAAECDEGRDPRPIDCPACYWHAELVPEFRRRFAVVQWRVLDAADYGVPQRRRRVILVCGPVPIRWPASTHSREALVWAKWGRGELGGVQGGSYWIEHGISPVGEPSREERRVLSQMRSVGLFGVPWAPQRWRTVRDALGLAQWATETRFSGGLLAVTGPERSAAPQSVRVLTADEPSDTLSGGTPTGSHRAPLVQMIGGNRGRAQGGVLRGPMINGVDQPGWTVDRTPTSLRVIGGGHHPPADQEATRTLSDLTDEPSTTIPAGYVGSNGPWVLGTGAETASRARRVLNAKHPPADPDAPMPTCRSGGDGHTAPPLYLRTEQVGASATSVDEPSPTQPTVGNQYLHPADPGVRRKGDLLDLDAASPTIRAQSSVDASGHQGGHAAPFVALGDSESDAVFLATGIRRLTPGECAILQGWPELGEWRRGGDYPLSAARTKSMAYHVVGNAVPPSLAEAVGRAVIEADATWRRAAK